MRGRRPGTLQIPQEVNEVLSRGRNYQFLIEASRPFAQGVADNPMNGTSFQAGSVNHFP